MRDYLLELQQQKVIQFLIFSQHNLRKLGAVDFLLSSAPGEIVSFADSDVFFLPGWLEASLQVIEAFPEAGQVTALPTIDKRTLVESTLAGIEKAPNLTIQRGANLIPEKFTEAHRLSLGKSPKSYYEDTQHRQDIRITRNGVSAYVTAQDFQFTMRKELVYKVIPLKVLSPEEYYDPIYSPVLERRLDRLGYWRLSTIDYLVHHMGNQAPEVAVNQEWIFSESQGLQTKPGAQASQRPYRLVKRLLRSRLARRLLKHLNAWTYAKLYEA